MKYNKTYPSSFFGRTLWLREGDRDCPPDTIIMTVDTWEKIHPLVRHLEVSVKEVKRCVVKGCPEIARVDIQLTPGAVLQVCETHSGNVPQMAPEP